MTTPELRATAERYRREAYKPGHFGELDHRNVGYLTSDDGWADRVILAEAYLAEHHADDDEEVTAEWEQSLVLAGDFAGYKIVKVEHGHLIVDSPTGDRRQYGAYKTTRGDLRRLCAALGIELEGTP